MEIKVLAAVFLTLFGIAVAMGQGELTADDLTDLGELTSRFQDNLRAVSDSGGGLLDSIRGGSSSGPAANTSMNASFTADTDRITIGLQEMTDTVELSGDDINVSVAGLRASPDTASITLRNYTGSISFNGNVTVDGTAQVVAFQDLSFDSDEAKEVHVYIDSPGAVTIDTLPETDLRYENVEGTFEFGGTSIDLDGDAAELRSFSGVFEKDFEEGYELNGKVYSAALGEGNTQTTIGGD